MRVREYCTVLAVKEWVESKGLEDCLTDISSDQIVDPILADAWERAAQAVEEIKDILENEEGEDDPFGSERDDE